MSPGFQALSGFKFKVSGSLDLGSSSGLRKVEAGVCGFALVAVGGGGGGGGSAS